jgi:hypothetical protein
MVDIGAKRVEREFVADEHLADEHLADEHLADEHLASDERLAAAFVVEAGYQPADIAKAHDALGGEPWEREIP